MPNGYELFANAKKDPPAAGVQTPTKKLEFRTMGMPRRREDQP